MIARLTLIVHHENSLFFFSSFLPSWELLKRKKKDQIKESSVVDFDQLW